MMVFEFDELHLHWEAVWSSWQADKRRSPTQGFTDAGGGMVLMKIRAQF